MMPGINKKTDRINITQNILLLLNFNKMLLKKIK
jgi:hypothetical protein